MFSHESRCIYENNQLGEVICQLRFPEILAIGANLPVDFQEAIRGVFPNTPPKRKYPRPESPECRVISRWKSRSR